ncbi:MAG: phosphopyruvate hydratase, partial [Rhodospirillales bacterium]|nr:phosphopyruvate hydratase [Rhodospirillales bacterium]
MSHKTPIKSVSARRIWDSRGRPTVEAEVILDDGSFGRGNAPAGASRGIAEAVDLRDGGDRHDGMDVTAAIINIEKYISPAIMG